MTPTIPEPIAAALGLRATTELRGLVTGARRELSVVNFYADPEKLAVVGVLEDGAWITWQLAPCGSEEEADALGQASYRMVQEMLKLRDKAARETKATIDRTRPLH